MHKGQTIDFSQLDCQGEGNLNKIFFCQGWTGCLYSSKVLLIPGVLKSSEMLGHFLFTAKYTKPGFQDFSIYIQEPTQSLTQSPGIWHGAQLSLLVGPGKVLQFRRLHKDPQGKETERSRRSGESRRRSLENEVQLQQVEMGVSFPHQNHLDPWKNTNPWAPSPKSNSRGRAPNLHLTGSLGDSEAY